MYQFEYYFQIQSAHSNTIYIPSSKYSLNFIFKKLLYEACVFYPENRSIWSPLIPHVRMVVLVTLNTGGAGYKFQTCENLPQFSLRDKWNNTNLSKYQTIQIYQNIKMENFLKIALCITISACAVTCNEEGEERLG